MKLARALIHTARYMALSVLAALPYGCAVPHPLPTPLPPNACVAPGRMMRAEGLIYEVSDCYSCESARGCVDEGNHYCCLDTMCSECSQSPVHSFGAGRPDGGAK